MPKLQPKPTRKYTINDTELIVKNIPSKEMIGYFKQYTDIKDDQEKLLDLYATVITEYTDLENTKDELLDLLGYMDIINLGNFIFDFKDENLE